MNKKRDGKVRISLKLKFSILIIIILTILLTVTSVYSGYQTLRTNEAFLTRILIENTKTTLRPFGRILRQQLLLGDTLGISDTMSQVKQMENIQYALLFDRSRQIIERSETYSKQTFAAAENRIAPLFKRKGLTITPPFDPDHVRDVYAFSYAFFTERAGDSQAEEKQLVGMLYVKLSTGALRGLLDQLREKMMLNLGIVLLIGLAAAVILAVGFSGNMVRPIRYLTDGTEIIGGGNLNHVIRIDRNDEIGLLARNFNSMTERIRDVLENLEEKVAERTRELQKTLDRVQALKEQQDGDYFLTARIIKPLVHNRVRSASVKLSAYMKQKQQFKFRNRESELGGDICISDRMKLRGERYAVFLNADAMGKSVQGSGGAIVIGIVFNSLLRQTKEGKTFQQLTPDLWLKYCYKEVQNSFVQFDGSMYISATIGLINETTGQFYFINAEHPWTVLYRDKQAAFVEEELEIHKFGMPLNAPPKTIHVRQLQLEDGDILIAGSDGKDDLAIGVDEENERVINEDETNFLRLVEQADGNLDDIVNRIYNFGEPTDDISLIHVEFSPGESGAV